MKFFEVEQNILSSAILKNILCPSKSKKYTEFQNAEK